MSARSETGGIDSDEDDEETVVTVLQRTHRWECAGRRGARAPPDIRRDPSNTGIFASVPCESSVHWCVHHRERTERKRSGAYARATQRRSSARRGGSITTDRRPCYHPPVRCSGSAADDDGVGALGPRRPLVHRTVAPAILSEPSLSSLPLSISLVPSRSHDSSPSSPSSSLLFSSLLFAPSLPTPRPPPSVLPLLPRNLRRCTRRPPLPITTVSARARYLRQLTSRTYTCPVCLSHR